MLPQIGNRIIGVEKPPQIVSKQIVSSSSTRPIRTGGF